MQISGVASPRADLTCVAILISSPVYYNTLWFRFDTSAENREQTKQQNNIFSFHLKIAVLYLFKPIYVNENSHCTACIC